jgi:Domain of unknown function (DUF4126)
MTASPFETLLSVAVGLGLAAACGFRVFVPLLAISAAGYTGHLPLASGFEWLGTWPAVVAFATATVLEVGAYYVPWLDHALDMVATPTAVVAGVVASAAVLTDVPPLLRWAVALIGGGTAAALIQGSTTLLRLKSGVFTGGLANAAVSTVELLGATATVVLAFVLPLVCLAAIVVLLILAARATGRLLFGRPTIPHPSRPPSIP